MKALVTGLALLLVGFFVVAFGDSFIDIVAGSPITSTEQEVFEKFPLILFIIGVFAVGGASIVALRSFGRR